ncbi:polysaccharide pyruvyl transferase family protein [Parapusillimonas granuli]|uniref:Polysaccharide pyruvyl transferase family protein n=1 Tax=Parapusillimonas granuli TaxID=380911 RepID=A0A853G048_9BURK|nr:polysaccharide pyruvyl transferase family protein [Parapusillimonas granuli]MBB5214177.1 polysaccharide pyruvyl transferase CsaB [Parapusillimonas granuli]MEB2399004.1 polysaccharide pyruvyl transferase family protein [Alcaligenaceae bacterium]NYT50598.1 polysaccharide pyruvyl transferase family protein [Parapusillimonas granuli]
MKNRPVRIGISGSYGGLNLGDEAILESIVAQLLAAMPDAEVVVFSRNTKDTEERHRIAYAIPVREITRDVAAQEIAQLDLLILGGGGILFDAEIDIYLREVLLANELGVPVMVYAVSAGPLVKQSSRELVRAALTPAALITVRDRQGHRLLEEVGLQREIRVTADPALLMRAQALPKDALMREGLDMPRRRIGFSVREPGPAAPGISADHYHHLLASAADFMVQRLDADVVFIPLERDHLDLQHSHAVVAQMQCAQRATVLKGEYSPGQIMTIIGGFEFCVGMRLHFLIFSALQGVPFVALPYASKVTGLLQELGMDTPPMDNVNSGKLLASIDHCWDYRANIKSLIRERLPALQDRARENNRLLIALLERLRAADEAAERG